MTSAISDLTGCHTPRASQSRTRRTRLFPRQRPLDSVDQHESTRDDQPSFSAVMGVGDRSSTARSTCLPNAVHHQGADDNKTRSEVSHDASQIGAAPFSQILQSLVSELVETSRGYVSLKLPIPQSRVKLSEPDTERSQVFFRDVAYCLLYLLNRAHSVRVPPLRSRRNCCLLAHQRFDQQARTSVVLRFHLSTTVARLRCKGVRGSTVDRDP
jgi:hypothetical protein